MSVASSSSSSSSPISISDAFDAGNGKLLSIETPSPTRSDIHLEIRPDPFCESDGRAHFQWFSFRASNLTSSATQHPHEYRFILENAGFASFVDGWDGYHCAASYDREHWFRIRETKYENGKLIITHRTTGKEGEDAPVLYLAYFAPYSYERHCDMLAKCIHSPSRTWRVTHRSIGKTLDGRDLDLLTFSPRNAAALAPSSLPSFRRIWVVARQHPGETMAEWLVEGLLERLLDDADPFVKRLAALTEWYVIPNINPDGSIRGHLRTNAAGANLNREWGTPTLEKSPEAFYTLQEMDRLGVDLLLDVHGDEAIPANFVAGLEGIPSLDDRLSNLQKGFCDALLRHSPDFQTALGYPVDKPKQANLKLFSKQIGERFKCLSLTFEQPFKDAKCNPDAHVGWSPERAKRLGAAFVPTIMDIANELR